MGGQFSINSIKKLQANYSEINQQPSQMKKKGSEGKENLHKIRVNLIMPLMMIFIILNIKSLKLMNFATGPAFDVAQSQLAFLA